MGYFSPGEVAILSSGTCRCATLVEFQFADGDVFLWNGLGVRNFNGIEYTGCGDLGTIEGLEEARSPVSQQVTFTLSGVGDSPVDLLARVIDSSDLVQGRLAIVSLQLFNDDWGAVGNPVPVYFGLMMPPRVTREPATETQGASRTISLPTENLFYGRHRPPSGRYTDREQQSRFPGDRFCEYVPQMVDLTLTWPDYLWLLLASSALVRWAAHGGILV